MRLFAGSEAGRGKLRMVAMVAGMVAPIFTRPASTSVPVFTDQRSTPHTPVDDAMLGLSWSSSTPTLPSGGEPVKCDWRTTAAARTSPRRPATANRERGLKGTGLFSATPCAPLAQDNDSQDYWALIKDSGS